MKSFCTANQKGGTGKTTTAANLAYALSRHGKTVMIDADPQASLSGYFLESSTDSFLKALQDGRRIDTVEVRDGLHLLPSNPDGSGLREWTNLEMGRQRYVISDLIDNLKAEGFKYALFDCHPDGDSYLERQIYYSVDEVLTVMEAKTFSFRGLDAFHGSIQKIEAYERTSINRRRVLINKVDDRRVADQVYSQSVMEKGYLVYLIEERQDLENAIAAGKFLAEYRKKLQPIEEYARLAEEVA